MQYLHITSGDMSGATISKTGIEGEVFIWHDILYDGPRQPGWLDAATIKTRTDFLVKETGGGLSYDMVLNTLTSQYEKLKDLSKYDSIILWFDVCLFDMSMLAHILTCLDEVEKPVVELICVDAFPGIEPYNGIGQLTPEQMASVFMQKQPVTTEQYKYAKTADKAFALNDPSLLQELAGNSDAPIKWMPAACTRLLKEMPEEGPGQLQSLILEAINNSCADPVEIFKYVAEKDDKPQYWGDTTLFRIINDMAFAENPLVKINGPVPRIPQWQSDFKLTEFTVSTV